jgi:hypothetical protein
MALSPDRGEIGKKQKQCQQQRCRILAEVQFEFVEGLTDKTGEKEECTAGIGRL